MTDPNYTLIAAVLDRSGSMASIKSDVEGGFNTYINDQKQFALTAGAEGSTPVRCEFMLAQFDNIYEVAIPYTDIGLVGSVSLVPRNMTALLDAIGKTINDVGARLAALPEDQRPGHVIIPIITDGMENASQEFTRQQIFDMITTQRDVYGWEFLFLAANQDAIATGSGIGLTRGSSLSYAPTSGGVRHAFAAASSYSSQTRSGKSASFADSDRSGAMDGQPDPSTGSTSGSTGSRSRSTTSR